MFFFLFPTMIDLFCSTLNILIYFPVQYQLSEVCDNISKIELLTKNRLSPFSFLLRSHLIHFGNPRT